MQYGFVILRLDGEITMVSYDVVEVFSYTWSGISADLCD